MSHKSKIPDKGPTRQLTPDALWKGLLDFFLVEFIKFFFPERVASQNITQVIPLDKEFTQLIPQAYQKTRYADKLVRVIFDHNTAHPVHFHIEIQGYKDQEFSKRMYIYDYRIYDRYGAEIEKLALFDRPSALPELLSYSRNTRRNRLEMVYYTYKVWEADTHYLETHANPIAQALLAVKEGVKVSKKPDEAIMAYKIQMVKRFVSKGYTEEEDQNLFIFVTAYVKFANPKMEEVFQEKLREIIPKTKIMSLVELFKAKQKEAEEYARKKGMEQGIQQGIDIGMEKSKVQLVKNWLESEAFKKGANTYEDITNITGLSLDEVKQIHREMEK